MTDPTVDELAAVIRKVDGHHEFGAGALAAVILAALADAGYVVVTEASLARALALAEVGCWANRPIHGPEQDAEVHQRDAAAIMGRLRETP